MKNFGPARTQVKNMEEFYEEYLLPDRTIVDNPHPNAIAKRKVFDGDSDYEGRITYGAWQVIPGKGTKVQDEIFPVEEIFTNCSKIAQKELIKNWMSWNADEYRII